MVKTSPSKSAVVASVALILLVIGAIMVGHLQAWKPEVNNVVAGGVTILGLVSLFVADLVQLWIHQDNSADNSRSRTVWEWAMIAGHGAVVVGASLFFVNYLVAVEFL